jgi:peptidoglycan hydrolase CwlO-like protein
VRDNESIQIHGTGLGCKAGKGMKMANEHVESSLQLSIRELQAENERLKAELDRLNTHINKLEATIERLNRILREPRG